MAPGETPLASKSVLDLFEGDQYAVARIRQLKSITNNPRSRPFIIVNLVSCLEWYARSKVKQLIDFHSDRINTNAKLLRDARINYTLLLRTRNQNFSLGDIIAISKNFSSVEDIEESIGDLIVRADKKYSSAFKKIMSKMRVRPAYAKDKLEQMFKVRHELVHGTPRIFIYEDEIEALATKRETETYISYSLEFIAAYEDFLRSSIGEYRERTTLDMRLNQAERYSRADGRLSKLEQAIIKRLPAEQAPTFAKSQRAWKLWRGREAELQAIHWWGGTGQIPAIIGEMTSLTLDRIRQLESLLRMLDQLDDR